MLYGYSLHCAVRADFTAVATCRLTTRADHPPSAAAARQLHTTTAGRSQLLPSGASTEAPRTVEALDTRMLKVALTASGCVAFTVVFRLSDRSDGYSGSCCFATHCACEWGKLFADQAILTEIEKDVSRTYPDLHFLSAAKTFPPLPLPFPFASPALPCPVLPTPLPMRSGPLCCDCDAARRCAGRSARLTVSHSGTEISMRWALL